jgi:hypothetical protein
MGEAGASHSPPRTLGTNCKGGGWLVSTSFDAVVLAQQPRGPLLAWAPARSIRRQSLNGL